MEVFELSSRLLALVSCCYRCCYYASRRLNFLNRWLSLIEKFVYLFSWWWLNCEDLLLRFWYVIERIWWLLLSFRLPVGIWMNAFLQISSTPEGTNRLTSSLEWQRLQRVTMVFGLRPSWIIWNCSAVDYTSNTCSREWISFGIYSVAGGPCALGTYNLEVS